MNIYQFLEVKDPIDAHLVTEVSGLRHMAEEADFDDTGQHFDTC